MDLLAYMVIGGVALIVGAAFVKKKSVALGLLGVFLLVGGATFVLAPLHASFLTAGVKLIIITVLFTAGAVGMLKYGGDSSRIAAIVLLIVGVAALLFELGNVVFPANALQNFLESAFRSISQIFGQAQSQIE